jgi:T5SS/PEP-CTERM-associated repeat protein
MATFTWNGGSASAADPTQWTPAGIPNAGDTAIVLSGDALLPTDAQLNSNTLEIGSATVSFTGDNSLSFAVPTLDQNTEITSLATNVSTAEATVLDSAGVFVNQGQITADGPVGSTFTLDITANGTAPGYFINYNQIEVDAGNAMTIAIGANSELFNVGAIFVNGGSLFVNAATNAIAGGYGPAVGAAVLSGGGTIETNVGYASAIGGQTPIYAFADSTSGNTLKIDNVGSFGGLILAFGAGDTIDVGTSLAVGKLVYSSSSGVLNLENSGGTILASLALSSGAFQSGTFTVDAATGVAGTSGFTVGTGSDGDTILTTSVVNDVYNSTSGTWQTAANWSNGVPGPTDTAFVGLSSKNPFILTTGSTAVSVGQLVIASQHHDTTVQITSDTTVGPYTLTLFDGLLDVTPGQTLTASAVRMTGGTLTVDASAVLNLTGHVVTQGIGATNGTITVQQGNTSALRVASGDLIVSGGTINAAPGLSGGGGSTFIGVDGSGTPAAVTVQNNGTNAGVVTDTYTQLSSDPTSFGVLTLDGNVSWTDTIDPHDTITSTGKMIVGINNQVANSGANTPPPFSNAATLLVQNGATLTDQNFAQIGASADSAGTATVQSGGVWNVGTSGIGVGFLGTGSLSILNGGTVAVGANGVSLGSSATAADGTITVSGTNALLTDAGGVSVGKAGHGLFEVLNNGTVQIAHNGIAAGVSAGSSGTVIVGGSNTPALLNLGTGASGITVGSAGQGTVEVQSGGTLQLNGTSGILVGQSAGAIGVLDVTGPNALITYGTTAGGLTVGSAGQGTVNISNGGTILLNGTGGVAVGTAAGGFGSLEVQSGGALTIAAHGLNIGVGATTSTGTVTVTGSGSSITTLGTLGGISVGSPGTGLLDINSGGSVASSAGVFIASTGTVMVTGGTLTDTGQFTVGSTGSGTLSLGTGGVVSDTGSFNIGFNGGSSGSVVIDGGTVTQSDGGFTIGGSNVAGTLHVGSNGVLTSGGTVGLTDINSNGTGQAAASVSGGTWNVNSQFIIGDFGTGSLSIDSAGVVNAGSAAVDIGNQAGGNGDVTVGGGNAQLDGGSLFIATPSSSAGTLTVNTGGTVAMAGLSIGTGGVLNMGGGTLSAGGLPQIGGGISGFGTLLASLDNIGTVVASSGLLDVTGSISGIGVMEIDGGSTMEVDGGLGSGQSVSFVTSPNPEALQLGVLAPTTQDFGISNWQNGDELIIANGQTVTGAVWQGGGTLEVDTTGATYDFINVSFADGTTPIFTTTADSVTLVSCFVTGTRVSTLTGEVAVENLREGDLVQVVAGGGEEPIVWIGHRRVDCRHHPRPEWVWPVRVSAGAFGPGRPYHDLWLSPDHAIYIGDVLIPVKHLVNDSTIVQVPMDAVTYYHVELPQHAVMLAQGLAVESYLDVGDRTSFANAPGPIALYPDFASRRWDAAGCAPLVVTGPEVEAARRWVNGLAGRAMQAA